MAKNFSEAAVRHFNDAELLAKASRWGNAGHLVGFAAECAVKHHLWIINPSAKAKAFHGHFPDLIAIARKHVSGRRDTALHAVLRVGPLMQGWDVNDGYAPNLAIGKPQYEMWRQHASRLMSAAGLKR